MVARKIKKDNRPDLFAAPPPLEALKAIISMCASTNTGDTIMVHDVSRAYFSALARRQVFAQLPGGDKVEGEQMVGQFNSNMYGTRDAAVNWERF